MAPHSSILAWEILWAAEPDGLQSVGLQELDMPGHTTCCTCALYLYPTHVNKHSIPHALIPNTCTIASAI